MNVYYETVELKTNWKNSPHYSLWVKRALLRLLIENKDNLDKINFMVDNEKAGVLESTLENIILDHNCSYLTRKESFRVGNCTKMWFEFVEDQFYVNFGVTKNIKGGLEERVAYFKANLTDFYNEIQQWLFD